nr:TIGR03915 family putative DNA repair protein [Lewinella sp. W8]
MTYDGTFAGLLSAIFESYLRKDSVLDIVAEDQHQAQLFETPVFVPTEEAHARRVLRGLKEKSGNPQIDRWLRRIFLTEQRGSERLILHYVRRQMQSTEDVSQDAGDEHIRQLQRLHQQMGREVHRMHAFVRFQRTADDLYVALINPDFNCLPLLGEHFAARYPAMPWLIYDTRRHYGLLWDDQAKQSSFITLTGQQDGQLRQLSAEILEQTESDYQDLWKTYFRAVDIPERRNMKLHLQHVPRRYWRYLIEK